MRLYDAHNHLQDERFGGCQPELVAACRASGVVRMVVNGATESDWPDVARLAREFPDFVIPAFGLHPWYVAARGPRWFDQLREHLDALPGAVIGEIGLDRWILDATVAARATLAARGIPVPVASIGSTPTATHVDHLEGIDEVRTGNYVFHDGMQVRIGTCAAADCALTVLTAVVHRDRVRGRLVVDAGAIALSKDAGIADADGVTHYGHLVTLDGEPLGLRVTALSQEHGWVDGVPEPLLDRLAVGARVRVVANHSCLTAAQFAHYEVHEGERLVARWANHRGW